MTAVKHTIAPSSSTVAVTDGQVLVHKDTGKLYIDDNGSRIAITDVIYVAEYPVAPLSDKLYITPGGAKLWHGGSAIELALASNYIPQSEKGAANGVAGLDANALVPAANLPKAGAWNYGITQVGGAAYGIEIRNNVLTTVSANTTHIDARQSSSVILAPSNLNYAVTAALTDANKMSLTAAQKLSAQDTLGVGPAPLILTTAPTTSTAGSVGQLYVDTTTSKTYHCIAAANTGTEEEPAWSYTWVDDVNANGGTFANDVIIKSGKTLKVGLKIKIGEGVDNNGSYSFVGDNCMGGNRSVSSGMYVEADENCFAEGVYSTICANNNSHGSESANIKIGNGTDSSHRHDSLVFHKNGNLYIQGGHQQGITVIPAATTAYTLAEGVQSHTPSAASTYTLPVIPQRIIADGRYFTRNPATDGTGYYGWLSGNTNRYTASATPSVGDNTYTNTALSSGAKAVTAIDERTHSIILDVDFTTVQTCSFEDSSGNALNLQKTIEIDQGDQWRFLCEYIFNEWKIFPIKLEASTSGGGGGGSSSSVVVSGTAATSAGYAGTYTDNGSTINSRPVYFCSDNSKYLFAIENGMDAGYYAWVFDSSTAQQAAGDTTQFYSYMSAESQTLASSPVGLEYQNMMTPYTAAEWSVSNA